MASRDRDRLNPQKLKCDDTTTTGKPCRLWAVTGEAKCAPHLRLNDPDAPRCDAITLAGKQCTYVPVPGETKCVSHVDPAASPTPRCGGTSKQTGKPCALAAGFKTDHPGAGNCQWHGGASPSGKKQAQRQMAERAVMTYGLRRDISATDALLEEVCWTSGHVAWLRDRIQAMEANDLVWGVTEETEKTATEFAGTDTVRSAVPNVWLDLYQKERKHLVDVTKAAIAANIDERRVRLAERQGDLVHQVISAILAETFGMLSLTAEQQARVIAIVPRHLRALAG